MSRGQTVPVGSTRVSANGYHYTKVEADGKQYWRLTHHIVAERKLGRPLREDERVSFIGKKTDLRADNIQVTEKGQGSQRRRLAQLEARRDEIQAEIDAIKEELMEGRKVHHDR